MLLTGISLTKWALKCVAMITNRSWRICSRWNKTTNSKIEFKVIETFWKSSCCKVGSSRQPGKGGERKMAYAGTVCLKWSSGWPAFLNKQFLCCHWAASQTIPLCYQMDECKLSCNSGRKLLKSWRDEVLFCNGPMQWSAWDRSICSCCRQSWQYNLMLSWKTFCSFA